MTIEELEHRIAELEKTRTDLQIANTREIEKRRDAEFQLEIRLTLENDLLKQLGDARREIDTLQQSLNIMKDRAETAEHELSNANSLIQETRATRLAEVARKEG